MTQSWRHLSGERVKLKRVSLRLFGIWTCDPGFRGFSPERRDPEMDYRALRCPCGSRSLRVSGWPRLAGGPGGQFWRTLARVWREARQTQQDGEPPESPFWLPLWLRCDACGREDRVLESPALVGRQGPEAQLEPREAYRCRICRRGSVEVVVGVAGFDVTESTRANVGDQGAVEVITYCLTCHRQARIAWSDGRPSSQELQLDHLYGRR